MQAGKDLPNLVQLGEMSGLDEVADRSYIMPMHTLLAREKMDNVSWFLASNSFVRNGRGQLSAIGNVEDRLEQARRRARLGIFDGRRRSNCKGIRQLGGVFADIVPIF